MGRVRIEIRLYDEEVVVHEFTRSTTALQQDSIAKMCQAALGWLQAYGDQATPREWEMEARKARTDHGSSPPEPSVSLRALP